MVFVAHHLAEVISFNSKIADQALRPTHGMCIKHVNARDNLPAHSAERMPKQLIQAADHQHGHAVTGPGAQLRGNLLQVVLDTLLR